MKKIIPLLMAAVLSLSSFTIENIAKLGLRKTASTAIGVGVSSLVKAQFTPTFNLPDSSCFYPGNWSGKILYKVKDSIGATNSDYFQININTLNLSRFKNTRNDGAPSSVFWSDNMGNVKLSPWPTSKRVEYYTGVTNSSGIVTFTFTAFPTAPIDIYCGALGTTNKETIIPAAAVTATSASYLVQTRNDILGLLPTYSVVPSRSVNVSFKER